jgi:hypothetical protein
MFFSFLSARRKLATARPKTRLQLELLEDRTLLNSRFVVPIASADNVTNFATLQAALTTPGLNAGDAIQIEPGSAPGNIVNADLPAVAGLTVRGDPAAALSAIPQFTVSDAFTVGAAQEGFTFRNVNIGLIQNPGGLPSSGPTGGSLVFTADGTIAGSAVVDISSSYNPNSGQALGAVLSFGGAADVLTDSTLSSNPATDVRSLLSVFAPNGSSTLVSDNVFDMANVNTYGTGAVSYNSNFSGPVAVVTDQLIGNTFINSSNFGTAYTAIYDAGSLSGLTIQDNTITDAGPDVTAIRVSNQITGAFAFQNTEIIGNSINLSGGGGVGVNVTAGYNGSTRVFIAGNQINAGTSGIGLTFRFLDISSLNTVVQGNDFHNDAIGVEVRGNSANASAAVIDLGGGSLGSLGGNDFRSFTAPATASSGAIVLNAFPSSQGTITAQKNSFAAGVSPGSVIWDNADSPALASVDASNNLTGNAAFVASLYADLLKRAGDTSNPNDAGGLIAALNSGALTQAAAASALVHSTGALDVQVDGLYLKLLGRPSDAPGRAGFVSFLQNGGSLEQVVALMVSSPEYAALTGSDAGFVQSLYTNLLGRTGTDSEVAGYVAALPSQGRAGVALDFLQSPEFRTDVVNQFYSATPTPTSVAALFPPLLHRAGATTTAEINGWVFSDLSVLDIETAFVSSTEFFVDG